MGRPPKYTDEMNDEIFYLHKQYPDMSQTQIAAQVGCSQAHVSKVLINNYKQNTIEGIPDLATILIDTLLKLKTRPVDASISNAITRNAKLLYEILKENQDLIGTMPKNIMMRVLDEIPPGLRDKWLEAWREWEAENNGNSIETSE